MTFHLKISHIQSKDLSTADTLCRAPIKGSSFTDEQFNQEVAAYMNMVSENLRASTNISVKWNSFNWKMRFVNNSLNAAEMNGQISDTYIPGMLKLYYFIAGKI